MEILITIQNLIRGERIPFPKDEKEEAFNHGIARAVVMVQRINKGTEHEVKHLILEGLFTDGAHHKQWYLEQIALALKIDMRELEHEALRTKGKKWHMSVAP